VPGWAAAQAARGTPRSPLDPAGVFEVEELAPGVWGALVIPRPSTYAFANSLVVEGEDGVLVVDTQQSPSAARALIELIGRRTDAPVRWVVNTHWHGDHTRANGLYLASFPGVEILGHESLLADVPERDGPALAEERERWRGAIAAAEQRLRDGVDEKGVALDAAGRADLEARLGRGRERLRAMEAMAPTPPTLALDGGLSLHRAGMTVRLLPFRGHTRGDLVVFLPEAKVLLSGDLLDELPYFGHGHPREWRAALDSLEGLGFDQVVPGHGGVLAGKDQLRTVRELLRVVTEAAAAAPATETAEGLAARLDLAAFRERLVVDGASERAWKEAVPDLAARALAEARGEP
jgi:glyoxylase-like metal-dependent hydrolase (beta-lactamase superfamily II)